MSNNSAVSNDVNYRSPTYCIARGLQRCEQCARLFPVAGLAMPPGHETLEDDAQAAETPEPAQRWHVSEAGALLFFIEYLPLAVQHRVSLLTPHYRLDYGESASQWYWMNHCAYCGLKHGDFDLYCEPGGAFLPLSATARARMRLYEILEPLAAQAAGYVYAPEYFNDLDR
jgi:hypothetical protein